ncbi:hypothetical protein [[Mycoplasma] imitans]|uniref:hypothetical protein n=1 Tax=[Mycoplasma] imitans TaxID=29560 RepID=UPI000481DFE4|nr:hypothetical protein [[Mycoplasma] imitans]
MDTIKSQIDKNELKELKKQISNHSKELVNLYSDWANQLKRIKDLKEIHKLSLKFGKEIVILNQEISKLTVPNKIKRPDYSKYTRPRIDSINTILKKKLNKTNYDYIFQNNSRFAFIQEEHKFNTDRSLEKLEKSINSHLITDDYKDKRCHLYLLDWYAKTFKINSRELLKNKDFIKCFIESCIDYESCYDLHFDKNNQLKKLEYSTCTELNHKHNKVEFSNQGFSLTNVNCIFYYQKSIKKFYWNILYKYLIEDSWIFGENNESQLIKINQLYNGYLKNQSNLENLKIIGKNEQKVTEFNLNKNSLLNSKQESEIQEFIQFFLIHQAKWHKKVSYLNFEYIFKKEMIDLVIEEIDLKKLDYLVIYLDNLNGINFLYEKIWQIIDFFKSINKNLNNESKTKIVFFNNIHPDKVISRLKRWNPQYDFNELKQAINESFYDNKKIFNFVFKHKQNNEKNDLINQSQNNLNTVEKSGKNYIFQLREYLNKQEDFFTELSDWIVKIQPSKINKTQLVKFVNYAIKIVNEISNFMINQKINPNHVQGDDFIWDKIELIYRLALLDKNVSRKLGETFDNSPLGCYFATLWNQMK